MIELNCTYKESKKILELGYDFSKVCWKSLYEYRDQYNLNRTFIKIHIHGTHLSLASIEDEIKHRMSKYGIVDLVTPIVPKDALEACLPFKVGIDARYFRKFYETEYSPEEFEVFEAGVNELESNAVIFSSSSIYEMFIWLHENYSEELKAKFGEVMG
jgi:hypothetical protein